MSRTARPSRGGLGRLTRAGALGPLAAAVLLFAAPLALSDFRLSLLAKFLCFAIVAVGLDLAWGYGGMLSLGQGLFFGLGGYAMAMHLKLEASVGGLPDFMAWSGVTRMPGWWKPFRHLWFALPAAVLIPALLAAGLGWLVFRSRVRGAYFAILTQALAAIFVILLVSQQGYTGGTNGLTNLSTILGHDITAPATQRGVYLAAAAALLAVYLLVRTLVRSRYGSLLMAVRDGEDRVRFLGYDPALVKTVAFALSAALAGLAGALFVPAVGIVAPGMLGIVPSIEMAIWVAIGGRGTLLGAVAGALVFSAAKTVFSESLPSGWLYLQGVLLVTVIVAAPRGLASLVPRRRVASRAPVATHGEPAMAQAPVIAAASAFPAVAGDSAHPAATGGHADDLAGDAAGDPADDPEGDAIGDAVGGPGMAHR